MKIGDYVQIVRQSKTYNPHITNIGYYGIVEDFNDFAVQCQWVCEDFDLPSYGAVDRDCVISCTTNEIPDKLYYKLTGRYKNV